MQINRVEKLYETAKIFLGLTYLAKCLIASHFSFTGLDEYGISEDEFHKRIFLQIMERDIYDDFKSFAENWNKVASGREIGH